MTTHKKTLLSATTTSNLLTVGNYLGAIKNWVALKDQYDCLFMAADLHSITTRQDPKLLRDRARRFIATYIASGIDPKQSTLFIQSHVPAHSELTWLLICNSTMGELSRMTQFKDKSAAESGGGSNKTIPAGLFNYPVLMAADILLYQTDLVPVGEDQKQHLELTRDLALRMNHTFGQTSGPIFKVPEVYIPAVGARIMSLQDPTAKMSKTDPDPNATVYLSDSDKEIEKKVKRAVTDSGSEISWDDSKPGVKNLLTIQAAVTGKKIDALVASYAGKQYGHLKVDTAEILIQAIRPIRDETDRLLRDPIQLDRILHEGAVRARLRAAPTLRKMQEVLGFVPELSP